MIHDFDEFLVCNKLDRNGTNGFLPINSIGEADFVFRSQDKVDSVWKPINVVGIFTKDKRIATTEDRYLPMTTVVKRDEEYSYLKDNDSIVRQAVKRLSCDSNLKIQFDKIRMIGCVEDDISITYVFQSEILSADPNCEMHIVDVGHLKTSDMVPAITKMIISGLY